MKKFVVAIEETISQNFEIEAKNAKQAIKLAEDKYQNGEFILEPGEVCFKQMAIIEPDDEETKWIEF